MKNEFYLAAWMADEIANEELQKLVSLEDFYAYKRIKETLENTTTPKLDVAASYADFLQKINPEKETKIKRLLPNWAYAVAAAVVLLFAVNSLIGENNTLTTYGEQESISLNDGSKVKLNAKSALRYKKNWEYDRTVFLEGEAYFTITKGDKFDVETKHATVSVLGTEFNIITRDNYFEVICYEGKVSVQQEGKTIVLTPGNGIRIIDNEAIQKLTTKEKTASWKSGVSKFNSVPVKHLFNAIENEFNITINSDNIDDNILFTGSFEHNNVEATLESICLLLDVKFSFNKNENTVQLYK